MKLIFRKITEYFTDFLKYFSFIFTLKTLKEYYISKNHQLLIDQYYIFWSNNLMGFNEILQ